MGKLKVVTLEGVTVLFLYRLNYYTVKQWRLISIKSDFLQFVLVKMLL
jgi:hypothetical protein